MMICVLLTKQITMTCVTTPIHYHSHLSLRGKREYLINTNAVFLSYTGKKK